MKQRTRIFIALGIILGIVAIVLGIDLLQRSQVTALAPGSIPVYTGDRLVAAFVPSDLEKLKQVSFVDDEEGKTQQGWLLRDVLGLYLSQDRLKTDTVIVVSSSSREKSATLTWAEVEDTDNMVMFDLSGRGTLKLVSRLPRLDVRDEWVQDVDSIEIQ